MRADVLQVLLIAGGAGVVALLAYRGATKAAAAVGAGVSSAIDTAKNVASTTLNPASDRNVVNSAVSAVGSAVSGDSSWTLGGWVYDLTHSDPLATPTPTPVRAAPGAIDWGYGGNDWGNFAGQTGLGL